MVRSDPVRAQSNDEITGGGLDIDPVGRRRPDAVRRSGGHFDGSGTFTSTSAQSTSGLTPM